MMLKLKWLWKFSLISLLVITASLASAQSNEIILTVGLYEYQILT